MCDMDAAEVTQQIQQASMRQDSAEVFLIVDDLHLEERDCHSHE